MECCHPNKYACHRKPEAQRRDARTPLEDPLAERLQHRCFSVNIAKSLRAAFL